MIDLDEYTAAFDGESGYLDWAGYGPLSPSVRSEASADAELLGSGRRSGIDLVAAHEGEARELLGELLGADASQVTLQPSTTYGIMQALYGLRGTIALSRLEYPALTVAASRAADAFEGTAVQLLEPEGGFVTPESVRDSLTDETAALVVSLVDYRTGYRVDLGALRDVLGDRLLIVDAAQAFGVVDADYAAADVVCGNGYKWLRAGHGTGFAWFGDRALERIAPVLSGFAGTGAELPVEGVPQPLASAQAFTVTGPDHLAVARLATALQDVRDVGVGVIEEALAARTRDIILLADRYDVPVVTPRETSRRAGIVTLAPAPQDVAPLAASLANHGLTVTVRGGLVRIAPHVGTGADTLRLLGDALAAFASARVW